MAWTATQLALGKEKPDQYERKENHSQPVNTPTELCWLQQPDEEALPAQIEHNGIAHPADSAGQRMTKDGVVRGKYHRIFLTGLSRRIKHFGLFFSRLGATNLLINKYFYW